MSRKAKEKMIKKKFVVLLIVCCLLLVSLLGTLLYCVIAELPENKLASVSLSAFSTSSILNFEDSYFNLPSNLDISLYKSTNSVSFLIPISLFISDLFLL